MSDFERLEKLRDDLGAIGINELHYREIGPKDLDLLEHFVRSVICPFVDKYVEHTDLPGIVGCKYNKSPSCQGKLPGRYMTCDAYLQTMILLLSRLRESKGQPKVLRY